MSPELKGLLDQVEQAVFVLEPDAEGIPRYVAFNRYACGHVERPEKEILGLTIRDLFPGRYGETIYRHHLHVLCTGEVFTYQAHLPLHGEIRQIEVTLRPTLDAAGRVVDFVEKPDLATARRLLAAQSPGQRFRKRGDDVARQQGALRAIPHGRPEIRREAVHVGA